MRSSGADGGPGGKADGAPGCEPTAPASETCDGGDNDCNGQVDDVDEGDDGIFDCQRIALFGIAGGIPTANFTAWLEGQGSVVERVQTTVDEPVDAALLGRFDVVIFDLLLRDYDADEGAAFTAWLEGGGAVLSLTGYSGNASDLTRPGSLLVGTGLGYTGALLNGPATVFADHPTTEGLTSVTFSGGYAIAVDPAATDAVLTARIGDVAIAAVREVGDGRVYLWGDEWVTYDSEWQGSPEVQAFWVNALGWLGRFR